MVTREKVSGFSSGKFSKALAWKLQIPAENGLSLEMANETILRWHHKYYGWNLDAWKTWIGIV
jgi:hypothetical protein